MPAIDPETWRVTSQEDAELRANGVTSALELTLGAVAHLYITQVMNVEDLTVDGTIGYMRVHVAWKSPRLAHNSNLRFNDDEHRGLDKPQLDVLGRCAIARPTLERDFTRDSNGLLLVREPSAPAELVVVELRIPPEAQVEPTGVLVTV